MNKSKVNTDQVITNIKKALYDLRDVDFDAMTEKERADFRDGFQESEELAHNILEKIAILKEKEANNSKKE